MGAVILPFLALCGSTVASGLLGGPSDVRWTSYNMDLVLRWDPPAGAPSGLLYNTQHRNAVGAYSVGCVNIPTLECNITSLRIPLLEHGTYIGRVQAHLGTESSIWVESNRTTLDRETIIGSPSVSLFSIGATIEVSIEDPVFALSTLRKLYTDATYNITYWNEGENKKINYINTPQNRVVLDKLDPWTSYCVIVQINTIWNSKPTKPSSRVCEKTTSEEVPWVAAVVTFVAMAMLVALVVVVVVYRRSISHFLFPKNALPQHFKEYLLVPHTSSIHQAMQNSHQPVEKYDEIHIITDDGTVDEGRPLEVAVTTCSIEPNVTVEER